MTKSNSGESLNHLVAVRCRVTGSGFFKLTAYSLDAVKSQALSNTTLSVLNNIEPTRLANFREMRMQIRFEVTDYDEYFVLDKLIPFVKESASSYPQSIQ